VDLCNSNALVVNENVVELDVPVLNPSSEELATLCKFCEISIETFL
jgi:hypothetical protein